MKRLLGGMLWIAVGVAQSAGAEPASNLGDLYKQYVDVGLGDGTYKAWRPPEVSMKLSAMRTDARYRVPGSIAFTFPQPFVEQSAAVAIMETVAGDLARVCAAGAGELKFEARPGIDEPKAERDIKRLQQRKLYGRYACASETAPFDIEVQAGRVVTERQLPPTLSWTIVLATATPEQILKLRDQSRRRDEEANAFRKSLKPGTVVAVSAGDVPSQHLGLEYKRYESQLRGRKFSVCGMVVEVREQLVQLQVGGGLFFVTPASVRPVKDQMPFGASVPLDDLESWCLKVS